MTRLYSIILIMIMSLSIAYADKNELAATIVGYGNSTHLKNNTGASVLITQGNTSIIVDMDYSTEEDLNKLGVKADNLSALLFTQKLKDENFDFFKNKNRDVKGGETFFINDIKVTTLKSSNSNYEISYRFDFEERSIIVTGDVQDNKALSGFARNSDFVIINSSGNVRIAFNQF